MASLKRSLRHLPAILGFGLLIGAVYVVQKEFRNLKFEDIEHALRAIPTHALVLAFVWNFLAYFILTFYDRLGTIYAGHKVSYGRVTFASFCAYTLSHNLGVAAVSGAAVRYRLYSHWGLTPLQIGKVVAFCSLTFGLGAMGLAGFVLLTEPDVIPFFGDRLPVWMMNVIGVAMWLIVICYVSMASIVGTVRLFGHSIELPGWRLALAQVALATIDVAVTATIFYALLPAAPGLTWWAFIGVYLASYSAGLAASLPGGIGVFDTAILLGLSRWLDAPTILSAIIVFRLYYYIIPLFLAGSLFAGNEIILRGGGLMSRARNLRAVQAIDRWSEPDFAVTAATGAVALCGVMLLCLSVIAPQPDFSWIDPDFGPMASAAGQFVPSLIGAGLLVFAVGLSHRVNLAWGTTIILLLLGAAFTVAQGEKLWIAAVLLLTMALIAPFRAAFYRQARLLSGPLQASTAVPLIALVLCTLALAAFERHMRFRADNAWWEIVLAEDVPNSVRLTIALTVAVALFAIWRLIRPGRVAFLPWNGAARLRLRSLGAEAPVEADGLVLGEAERSGIAFRRLGNVLLGLGDPAGAESDRVSAVWRLRDLAVQEGRDPAFFRAGPSLLPIYGDLGLTALPLGSDGLPLPESPGDTPAAAHYLVCVAERDLKMLLPLLPELAANQEEPVKAAAE